MAAVVAMASSAVAAAAGPFHVENLAPGIYAVINDDPLGLANHANSMFIVGDEDVIVVDTQFTLERTAAVLAVIRETTDKPVRTVINTHWHDDHTFGNQVYRAAFPDLEIVAHAATRSDMEILGVQNRAGQVSGGPDALAYFRNALEHRTSVDGTSMSDSEVAAYRSTIGIVEEYLGDMDDFILTLPTRTFVKHLTLWQGDRRIEVLHTGGGVTQGDAIVFLPAEGVLAAGDLLDNPLPFSYGANVDAWLTSLDAIERLGPRIVVPGHGGVMRDNGQAQRLRSLLTAIRNGVREAASRGQSLEEISGTVNVIEYRTAIAGDDKMLGFLFDRYFLPGVLKSTYNAANPEQQN